MFMMMVKCSIYIPVNLSTRQLYIVSVVCIPTQQHLLNRYVSIAMYEVVITTVSYCERLYTIWFPIQTPTIYHYYNLVPYFYHYTILTCWRHFVPGRFVSSALSCYDAPSPSRGNVIRLCPSVGKAHVYSDINLPYLLDYRTIPVSK